MCQNKIIRGGDSESINFLRFPLAVLVVFVHGFGKNIDVLQLHASGLSGDAVYDYIRLFFSEVIARSAVPIFFFMSGYLLFFKVKEYSKSVYIAKLRKRWHSLVVPYFSWILLMILWTLMFKLRDILFHGESWQEILEYFRENGYLRMFWDGCVWEERTTWLGIVTHMSGPVLLSFWYMRDLVVMVFLSPIIYWTIKKFGLVWIGLLFAIYAFDIRVTWISDMFASACLFFSFGAYFSIKKKVFTDVLWKWRYVILPLALVLIVWQTYTASFMGDRLSVMIHPWLVIVQSFALIILASALCRYQWLYLWNKKRAKTSFFIYALHFFILYHVISIINKVIPMGDTWYMMTISYLIAPLACVGICIGVYYLAQRFCPSILSILIGVRK